MMMMAMKKDAVATKLEAKGQRRCHRGQSPKEKNLPKMQLIARRRPAIRHMLHSHGQKKLHSQIKNRVFCHLCQQMFVFGEANLCRHIIIKQYNFF